MNFENNVRNASFWEPLENGLAICFMLFSLNFIWQPKHLSPLRRSNTVINEIFNSFKYFLSR